MDRAEEARSLLWRPSNVLPARCLASSARNTAAAISSTISAPWPPLLARRLHPEPPPAQLPTALAPAARPQLAAETAAPVDPSSEFFVRIEDGEFVAGCERFLQVRARLPCRATARGARSAAAAPPSICKPSRAAHAFAPSLVRQILHTQIPDPCTDLQAGWNQWEVVEAAAGAPALSGASIPVNMTGPEVGGEVVWESCCW